MFIFYLLLNCSMVKLRTRRSACGWNALSKSFQILYTRVSNIFFSINYHPSKYTLFLRKPICFKTRHLMLGLPASRLQGDVIKIAVISKSHVLWSVCTIVVYQFILIPSAKGASSRVNSPLPRDTYASFERAPTAYKKVYVFSPLDVLYSTVCLF